MQRVMKAKPLQKGIDRINHVLSSSNDMQRWSQMREGRPHSSSFYYSDG